MSKEEYEQGREDALIDAWELHRAVYKIPQSVNPDLTGFYVKGAKKVERKSEAGVYKSILRCLDDKRTYLVDSGASHHLVRLSDLTPAERATRRRVKGPPLRTANGRVVPKWEADIDIDELGLTVTAYIIDKKNPMICQWEN